MNQINLGLVAAIITLIVAVMSIRTGVLTPTGAAIAGGAMGSLSVAIISLIIALTLFAKYFNLIK
jgi:hypothetical protein